MVEQAHIETVQANSKLTFEDSVIAKITGRTAQGVEGLLSMNGGFFSEMADRFRNDWDSTKGIEVEVGEKQVAIDMTIILEYGQSAREVFNELARVVTEAVEAMTGLTVIEVNTHVADIMTKKEWLQHGDTNRQESAQKRVD